MRYLLILQSIKLNKFNRMTMSTDLSPFQNTRETKPVIADTQFSAARNSFQTNNTVGRLIIVIRDTFCRFCVFSAFLQPRHRLSIYEFLFFKMAPFSAEQNGWLALREITASDWSIFSREVQPIIIVVQGPGESLERDTVVDITRWLVIRGH